MFRKLVLSLAAAAGMVAQLVLPAEAAMDVGASRRQQRWLRSRPSRRRSSSGAGGITAGTIQPGEARAGTGAATRGRVELAGRRRRLA